MVSRGFHSVCYASAHVWKRDTYAYAVHAIYDDDNDDGDDDHQNADDVRNGKAEREREKIARIEENEICS